MVDMPSPSSSAPSLPSLPKGLKEDLLAFLKGDKTAMLRVGKNPAYFGTGIAIFLLAQLSYVANQWFAMKEVNDLAQSFGLDLTLFTPMDLVIQGLFGIVGGAVVLVAIYMASTRVLKGKAELDMKQFATVYFFALTPAILTVVPIVGVLAGLWVLVLVFLVMMTVFGFNFWKALGALLLGGFVSAIALAVVGQVLGIPGYSASFSFDY